MDVNNIRDSIKRDIKAELKPRKLLRTALIPQTKGLLTPLKQVFEVFVLLIAQMFVSARLIPKTHPAMEKTVTGLNAIWLMIVDASANLSFKRENIYQLVVFYGIVGMLIFGALDFISFLMHFSIGYSHAAGALNNTSTLFNEDGAAANDQGPAWINTMFPYANNATSAQGLPGALQAMLLTYNSAILALATSFALYQLAHLFMESAHHGKYGGQRYSQLYAPLRMVIGIGLLVPASNGFNSAQIIAIQMAKMGSGLASHVWTSFEAEMSKLSSVPANAPTAQLNIILQKLVVDETCMVAAQSRAGNTYGSSSGVPNPGHPDWNSKAYLGIDGNYTISFNNFPGDSYCGSISIPHEQGLNQTNHFEQAFVTAKSGILDQVWDVANMIYHNSNGGTDSVSTTGTDPTQNPFSSTCVGVNTAANGSNNCLHQTWDQFVGTPGIPTMTGTTASYTAATASTTSTTGTTTQATATPGLTKNMQDAAAASFNDYQQNVASKKVNTSTPDWTKAGYLFLLIAQSSGQVYQLQNPDISVSLPNNQITDFFANKAPDCSGTFSFIYYTCEDGKTVAGASYAAETDVTNSVSTVGMQVFDFASGSTGSSGGGGGVLNSTLRAPLTSLETGMFQAACGSNCTNQAINLNNSNQFGQSIFNVIQMGNILLVVAGSLYALGAILGTTLTPILGLIVVMLGSAIFPIGVSLAIMIPLMPAARFIFGIFTWLLTLFEAMVAMPIVALVTINYEGEGLFAHGKAGWFFLLQMMLRPVLMVFGLLGGIMIFDTLAGFISQSVFGTWFSITNVTNPGANGNVAGSIVVSFLQMIGFMYFYALTLYSCANISFQLINTIPDRILSWSGLPGGLQSSDDTSNVMQQAQQSSAGMLTVPVNAAAQSMSLIGPGGDKSKASSGGDKDEPNKTNEQITQDKKKAEVASQAGGIVNGGTDGNNPRISKAADQPADDETKQLSKPANEDANILRDRYGD